jgi:hypothetical protein
METTPVIANGDLWSAFEKNPVSKSWVVQVLKENELKTRSRATRHIPLTWITVKTKVVDTSLRIANGRKGRTPILLVHTWWSSVKKEQSV